MTTQSGPGHGQPDPGLRAITSERRQLLNLAYRLPGPLADAEDAVLGMSNKRTRYGRIRDGPLVLATKHLLGAGEPLQHEYILETLFGSLEHTVEHQS